MSGGSLILTDILKTTDRYTHDIVYSVMLNMLYGSILLARTSDVIPGTLFSIGKDTYKNSKLTIFDIALLKAAYSDDIQNGIDCGMASILISKKVHRFLKEM